jgi:hypothetical protein
MSHDTAIRAHGLVEELRAEVDFEIDDVIANIIRNLPEEYFRSLAHEVQLTHLKALLAISICNLKRELTLRSDDNRHVAVIARQNYPGLLAKIIAGLPDEQPLIGAKIFTSITHDFIIDLFEFKPSSLNEQPDGPSQLEKDDTVEMVARLTGESIETVTEFVAAYPPGSRVLASPEEVHEHYLAFREARSSNDIAVRWVKQNSTTEGGTDEPLPITKITVSASKFRARDLFQATAEFLSQQDGDIEQAFLDDFPLNEQNHIAISSFVVSGRLKFDSLDPAADLANFLRDNDMASIVDRWR